jgi:hypothetical protein
MALDEGPNTAQGLVIHQAPESSDAACRCALIVHRDDLDSAPMNAAGRVHLVEDDLGTGDVPLPEHCLHAREAAEHAHLHAVGGDARAVLCRCRPRSGDHRRNTSRCAQPEFPTRDHTLSPMVHLWIEHMRRAK